MQSDWSEYARRIAARRDMPRGHLDGHGDSYLHTLSVVAPLLRSGLASADEEGIARILGRRECGWLGMVHLMRGRGARIGTDTGLQGLVDDCIRPLWAAEDQAECLAAARTAFARLGEIEGFGPGFIARMLALAKPDRFYSYNDTSSSGLTSLFGVAKSKLGGWAGYEEGLRVVYATRWYRSPEPATPRMRRVWSSRVALLDAYAYPEPSDA